MIDFLFKNPLTIENKLLSIIPYKPGIPIIPINLAGGHGFPLPKKKGCYGIPINHLAPCTSTVGGLYQDLGFLTKIRRSTRFLEAPHIRKLVYVEVRISFTFDMRGTISPLQSSFEDPEN